MVQMKISITLPSLHPTALMATLDNIGATTKTHELEVLVCSPFNIQREIPCGRVVWVKDRESSGNIAAHAAAAKEATGELITAFVDDHEYVDGWDVKAVTDFLAREAACGGYKIFCLGLRQLWETPQVGTVFGIYYPYFPMMRRGDLNAIGGWFDDTKYKRGFGDADLGLRVWFAGGLCEWSEEQIITTVSGGPANHHEDEPRFLERWVPIHGTGWDTSHLRGWNIDVPLSEFPPGTRTCYQDVAIVGNRS
jgi:hypothetical protein